MPKSSPRKRAPASFYGLLVLYVEGSRREQEASGVQAWKTYSAKILHLPSAMVFGDGGKMVDGVWARSRVNLHMLVE